MVERVMAVEKKKKPIRRMVQVEVVRLGKKRKRTVQAVMNQVKQLKKRQKEERRVKMVVVMQLILGNRNQTLGRQKMEKKLNKHRLN